MFVMGEAYDPLVSLSDRNSDDTEDMANTSSRTLRLLSLLQTHRYWPGAELADRLEVSVRTLRRDVDRLRELGYPVEANRGVDGGYQLAAGAAMPPLVLDDEEAVALAVGLQAAAQGGVAGVAEASVRALAKVVPVMPPRLRRRVEALRTATVPGDLRRRRTGRRPGRAHHRRAGLPRHRAAGVRLRRRRRSADRTASWSRSGSSRSAAAGTSSPTTCTVTTGAASASTGSTLRGGRVRGSARATCLPTTRRRSSASGLRNLPTSYDVEVLFDAPADAVRARVGRWVSVEEAGDGLPHADEHGLAGLGRTGGRRRGSGVHRRGPGGTGAAPAGLGTAVRPVDGLASAA